MIKTNKDLVFTAVIALWLVGGITIATFLPDVPISAVSAAGVAIMLALVIAKYIVPKFNKWLETDLKR